MSSTEMTSTVAAPSSASVPALTASQIGLTADTVVTALKGKSANEILSALPNVVVQVYQLVVSFNAADEAQIQSVVLTLLTSAIGLLPLPPTEQELVDTVLSTLVPQLIALLPKIEAGLVAGFTAAEQDVDTGCTACCAWLKTKLGC